MKLLQINKTKSLLAITSILLLAGCNNENQDINSSEADDNDKTQSVSVIMKSTNDHTVSGQVNFNENNNEVSMDASFTGLQPGAHAIHLHAKADCSAADAKSAGGHWNPTNEQHGEWGSQNGYHKGDIGNFDVDDSGNGHITMQTNEWCIGCNDDNKNILGKSVIVHQGSDDFTSQPSGNAGTRVACGEIVN